MSDDERDEVEEAFNTSLLHDDDDPFDDEAEHMKSHAIYELRDSTSSDRALAGAMRGVGYAVLSLAAEVRAWREWRERVG